MNRHLTRSLLLALLLGALAACGHAAPDEDDAAAAPANQVVDVTVATPRQQTFHDTVKAWGSADPVYPIAVNLPHGGQIADLNVAPGQAVKRGDRLLTVAPDPTAQASFRQAQTAVTLAAGDLKRTEQLAAERLATQSQLATARKTLADAQAALAAQRALGGGAGTEPVKAPLDGVVTDVSVKLGERFAANAQLLSFTPAHTLLAQLGVQPEDGDALREGMPVNLHAVYGKGVDMTGKLSMVGQSVDPQTHLVPVIAELPASGRIPAAGTLLAATIQTADYRAWALPRAAVLHDDKSDYVWLDDHGHAKRVAVSLRHPDGDTVGVLGPLDAQAQVIVVGAYELNDGDAVKAHAPGAASSTAPVAATSSHAQ